ncbi:LppP/LprE family lipoprotein [Conexibacter stalactiti]|uniref:LppP/LprE family lipoprotein n=1 Tax=Conexibacter stalactiti TaxID=1940611 RepID=A0ABU4HYT0_9ACTN|nr:LppP/LprE family lipoprotein [Conexibacter stalactiti]MDW5598465.1 LppP/LprE family lipoprotein [Conexibacter stalactiti]MEC5039107.1 LppP/LprE family lipoprotein [Conexibacter stalactiti]
MSIARSTTITCALAALALGAAACGDSDDASTTVVERATVTRTVTVPARPTTPAPPPETTPATTPPPAAPLTLRAAEQVLDGRGFATLAERDWRPDQNLKVLLGVRRGVSDDGAQQAFFFVGDRFIGTDTRDPSGRIAVTAQSDDAITLAYGLYRPDDSIESPSGGETEVTYTWDGDRLSPQEPIPPSATDAALSRR